MRPLHLALLALALLAGSAGYVTQQWLGRSAGEASEALAQTDPVPSAEPADAPLAWSFVTPGGDRHRLDEWAGKVLVVNFWATWCPPCLREIPAFIALQAQHGADGLQFVGVALDQAEPVADFVADKKVNYPVLVGDADVARLMQRLGNEIGGLPYTVVFDRAGNVALTHQGEWEPAAAAQALAGILEGP